MRLEAGTKAPSFSTSDAGGTPIGLDSFAGQKLWLILSRFAACPFCSLRLDRIARNHSELELLGVAVLVVFPSPPERIAKYAATYKPPFRVAADPGHAIFEKYGVGNSWAGEMKTAVQLGKVMKALAAAKQNPLAMDAAVHQMPADFLVRPGGTIDRVRYGRELDDGFSVQEVVEWASSNT
jgi:peroxiredoxin